MFGDPHKTPAPRGAAPETLEQLVALWTETNNELRKVHRELVSTRGIMRAGCEARQITNNQSMRMSVSAGALAGFSIRETSGVNGALVRVHDGFDANGDVLVIISLAANESTRDWLLPAGIGFTAGLYLEIANGTVEGAVYLAPAGA